MGFFAPYPNPFDDALIEIERRFNEVITTAQSTVSGWVDVIADAAVTAINWVVARWNEFMEWVSANLYGLGSCDALDDARDQWRDSIGGRGAENADRVNAEAMTTDSEWRGRGADAYNDRVPTQQQALRDIDDVSEAIASALGDLSGAMSGAITTMNATIGTLGVAMVVAIPCVASLVGIPIGLGELVIAIAGALISLGATHAIFGQAARTAESALTSTASTDFTWPRMTVV